MTQILAGMLRALEDLTEGVIGARLKGSDQGEAMYTHILIPTDGSELTGKAVEHGGGLAKRINRLLARMGVAATVHGFRASFRTWAAEQTNFPREVAEQSLAHIIPDAVERAYKRTTLFDKRRQLMAAWAKYVSSAPVQRRAGDNVVSIGGAR